MLETILVLCNTFFSSFICCSLVFYVSFFILWVYRRLFLAFVCWILGVIFCYLAFLWLFWLFPFFSFIFYFFTIFQMSGSVLFGFAGYDWPSTCRTAHCSGSLVQHAIQLPRCDHRPSTSKIAILVPKNRWLVEPSSGTVSITAPPPCLTSRLLYTQFTTPHHICARLFQWLAFYGYPHWSIFELMGSWSGTVYTLLRCLGPPGNEYIDSYLGVQRVSRRDFCRYSVPCLGISERPRKRG